MGTNCRRPRGRDNTLSSLNVTIEALNLAKEISFITPAKAIFGSVSSLLTMIRVRFVVSYNSGFQVHIYPGLDGQ